MKNSTIVKLTLTLAIIVMGFSRTFGQGEVAKPANFQEHGNNSLGTTVASENTDSVTVGSALQYWVEPDASISGTSSFSWSISGLGALGGSTSNLETITFGSSTGTGTISVVETAPSTPSCPGSSRTIDFAVVAAPTAAFGTDPAAQCYSSTSALTFTVPITVTTPIVGAGTAAEVRVNYTVHKPDGSVLTAAQDGNFNAGAERTFTVSIPSGSAAGTYYVEINSITDRISRKPATDILGTSSDNRIDLVVNPVPVTGPIYHLPNM